MKKCPYCAEDIQDGAIKCKHCKSNLNVREELDKLERRWEDNNKIKEILETIISRKKELDSIPKKEHTDNQIIWLLAQKSSEVNLESDLKNDKEGAVRNMLALFYFIEATK